LPWVWARIDSSWLLSSCTGGSYVAIATATRGPSAPSGQATVTGATAPATGILASDSIVSPPPDSPARKLSSTVPSPGGDETRAIPQKPLR